MEFPYTVESQDAFDDLVKDRLSRERAKFANHEDLKARAEQADAAIAAAEQATAEAVARAETAEGRITQFEGERQLAAWRAEVAEATGVPAAILRGSTKEEFEAHATELQPLLTAQTAPVVPGQQPKAPPVPGITQTPRTPGNVPLRDQIAAAEKAGDKTLTATLKAMQLGQPTT